MPYYHATYAHRLGSIQRHGLGAVLDDKNFVDSENGVFLAENPLIAIMFLVEHYAATGAPDSSPKETFATFRVLVIDDGRVDPARLVPDPSAPAEAGCWLYRGVIDVRGLAVLDGETVYADVPDLPLI